MTKITISCPDDWHVHLRDNEYLECTVAHTAKQFTRAIVMPNLSVPITTAKLALEYRNRIIAHMPNDSNFTPLMTLYLTDKTTPKIIIDAISNQIITACKLYPANATTNSQNGVTNLKNLYGVFEEMTKHNLPLLIHPETTNPNIDIFNKETYFIENTLPAITNKFPNLKIVLEHITSEFAVNFVKEAPKNIAATITAHHLHCNRNDIFQNGINPHLYCLPILKTKADQKALIKAATSGNAKFFLGTDSAPHPQNQKETSCGCAGIFTAPTAIELYTEIFDNENALDKLEAFACQNGANFYNLPTNKNQITLVKEKSTIAKTYKFGTSTVIPFKANQTIHWKKVE